jgi:hypothetical protein
MIGEEDSVGIAAQIASYRKHALDLDALLRRVKQRGGPAAPWKVELRKRLASLGPIDVSFYALTNGGFSPAYYTRKDCPPDQTRDRLLLEDAFACIAEEIKKAGKGWVNPKKITSPEDVQTIEAWLLATGKSEAELGELAAKNHNAIEQIRAGTGPADTLLKVLSYIRRHMPRTVK